jgi:pseudouridine kinase
MLPSKVVVGSSNPATMRVSFGGVARNVAEVLARLGADVSLGAAIGRDAAGDALLADCAAIGIGTNLVLRMTDHSTAEYAAVIDAQGLVVGAAAMADADRALEASLPAILATVQSPVWIFADTNLSASALALLCDHARRTGSFLAIDAVSVAKSARLPARLEGVDLLVMNVDEAASRLGHRSGPGDLVLALREAGAAMAVVTSGSGGVHGVSADGVVHCPAMPVDVVDVTGAGDNLTAALLWRLSLGDSLGAALPWGVAAATLALETSATVPSNLSADFLRARVLALPMS